MKQVLILYVFISACITVVAQPTILEQVWATSSTKAGLDEVNTRVDKLVASVSKHHYRNDVDKLHSLFRKTHSRFLHNYVQYTGIEGLAKGQYDCLTATSLFADILTRAGYKYNIIETNYHIFIVVNSTDGDVILETTDRFGGFISDKTKMNKAVAEYQANKLQDATTAHQKYSFSLYQSINADQLAGLLYFNQAVNAFNDEKWEECSEKLSAAKLTTNSPRIGELAALLQSRSLR